MKLTVREVATLHPRDHRYAPSGDYRQRNNTPGGHPADGMLVDVSMGDGAVMTIINPGSFEEGGPEWTCRYGDIGAIRYSVAGLLESYDYLLSDDIDMKEAARRLRTLRAVRAALSQATGGQADERD